MDWESWDDEEVRDWVEHGSFTCGGLNLAWILDGFGRREFPPGVTPQCHNRNRNRNRRPSTPFYPFINKPFVHHRVSSASTTSPPPFITRLMM